MDLKSRTIPRSRPRPIIVINTTLMASVVWVLVGLTFIQNAEAASLPSKC